MSLPFVFHADERAGLGDNFLRALEAVYADLQRAPKAHQMIYRDVRRVLPRRFPYGVFYRVHPDRIEVIAVQHCRRDPARWQARV